MSELFGAVRRVMRAMGVLVLCAPHLVGGQETQGITPAEMLSLPEYCRARYGNDQALKGRWNAQMGTQHFLHVHHYCSGLNFMRRSSAAVDSAKRRYALEQAINEFGYVLRNWPPEFQLYAQAQQQQKMARTLLGKP